MKKVAVFLFCLLFFLAIINTSLAYEPLSVKNNQFGVHILFSTEIKEAAKLVNSNGGDWGYVTIPIQAIDKDLTKWQDFMDEAKELHIIPIIRLATNGDYFNTKVWKKPEDSDIVDFANFLNSLDWPTKNRYVIVFNEVNRADEWGGSVDPQEYAKILQYAVSSFKSRNSDFFIISAGFDNAASNIDGSMNEYQFMKMMDKSVSGIFSQIDGIASHAYPNPGFSQPPDNVSSQSISSFKSEKQLADSLSNKNLPVFITETGWSAESLSDAQIAEYFKISFDSIWSDENIVAVTPFLLLAGAEPFKKFSLIDTSGGEFLRYMALFRYPKTKGEPIIAQSKSILGSQTADSPLLLKHFDNKEKTNSQFNKEALQIIYEWLLRI